MHYISIFQRSYRTYSTLLIIALTIFLSNNSLSAREIINIKLVRGWYVITHGDSINYFTARLYGYYTKKYDQNYYINPISFRCEQQHLAYLKIMVPPEFTQKIQNKTGNKYYNFLHPVTIKNKVSSYTLFAWFRSGVDGVFIEFPHLTKNNRNEIRDNLLSSLLQGFTIDFNEAYLPLIKYSYMTDSKSNQIIKFHHEAVGNEYLRKEPSFLIDSCNNISLIR